MKVYALSAVLAASVVQGYLIPPKTHKIDWKLEQKRQIVGTITSLLGKGGRVSAPFGSAPVRVALTTESKVPGAKRIKYRYGPYQVPNMNKTSIVGEAGMLWNFPDLNIPKPCTECTIIAQWAGLEYPDGRNANIDSGMWLHHMVHLTIGPGRWDPTCYGRSSLPHIDVNSSPQASERYFSSGNERTRVHLDILGPGATKWGYHLKPADRYGFIVDLMNMNMKDEVVFLTMTYDFLEGPLPAGWDDVKVVWFDANQCGTSEVRPPKQTGSYTITSYRWTPNFAGKILGVGGHLHDGGIALNINYNTGKLFCSSKAGYAEKEEYIQKNVMNHGNSGGRSHGAATKHISSMTACYLNQNLPVPRLDKSQSWYVEGIYDYSKFDGMKDPSGWQSEVMAIALMFVAVKPGVGRS